MADIKKALVPKKHTDFAAKVLPEHHKHLIAFSRKEANKLLKRRPYNHKIVIEKGKHFRFGLLYRMS